MTHSKTPWHQGPHYQYDIESPSGHIGSTANHQQGLANAAYIVQCVNSHAALVEALKDAIVKIESEYCSHRSDHGATNQSCYANKQHAALATVTP